MSGESRSELLKRYREAPALLNQSVAGSSMAQLDGAPPEPGWTAREIVHHVADIAIMGALRLRMMLLDVEVEYWMFEQEQLQQRLRADQRSIGPSLRVVESLVEANASILSQLRDDEWAQPRPMPNAESRSVEEWLQANVGHISGHIDQIRYALTGTC